MDYLFAAILVVAVILVFAAWWPRKMPGRKS